MRLAFRVAALAAALLVTLPPHGLFRLFGWRSPWPRVFLRWAGYCVGLRVRREGAPLGSHVLFVSNHVSWLDILALGGATGAIFVSRDDVEGWPVLGRLAALNETLYVARDARRQVQAQSGTLRAVLASGRAVALFPEGTTEGGEHLLPFRPSLFAALFPPLDRLQVQPVAIDYGPGAADIAWVGQEPAGVNAKRILRRRGMIPVTLRFLPPLDPAAAGDRKTLAAAAMQEVGHALGHADTAFGAGRARLYAAR